MEMYQHDSAMMFRFVLRGDLTAGRVPELEHAWTTAKSILNGRDLVVDVSGITGADEFGVDLLSRMRDSGARLTAPLPPASEELLRSSGVPVAAQSGEVFRNRRLRFLRACRAQADLRNSWQSLYRRHPMDVRPTAAEMGICQLRMPNLSSYRISPLPGDVKIAGSLRSA